MHDYTGFDFEDNLIVNHPVPANGANDDGDTAAPDTGAGHNGKTVHFPTIGFAEFPAAEVHEPVDFFTRATPPAMPLDLLPVVISNLAADNAYKLGGDPAITAMGCLVACASLIDDGHKVQPKRYDTAWKESARLWGAIVGDVSAKKTPMLKEVIGPLHGLNAKLAEKNKELEEQHKVEMRVYEADLKKYAKEASDGAAGVAPKGPEKPQYKRALVNDTTTERLVEILSTNERGLLSYHDELSGFFGSMDGYRSKGVSKDRPFWLEAYNGGTYLADRMGRAVSVSNCSVSILGGIQPKPMIGVAKSGQDDGLLQRFMIVVARAAGRGRDVAGDVQARIAWDKLAKDLYDLTPPGGPFGDAVYTLDSKALDARLRIEEFAYNALSVKSISPALASHMGKWDGLFARLLLTWHIVEHVSTGTVPPLVIAGATAVRVERFMREYLFKHAHYFYCEITGQSETMDHAGWIADYILSKSLTEIRARQIKRDYRAMKGASNKEVVEVMELLGSFGWVDPVLDGPVGRDIDHWSVNPSAHEAFAAHAENVKQERQDLKARMAKTFEAAGK